MKSREVSLSFCIYRSSLPTVFYKKGIIENFSKFTGITYTDMSLFSNKNAGFC